MGIFTFHRFWLTALIFCQMTLAGWSQDVPQPLTPSVDGWASEIKQPKPAKTGDYSANYIPVYPPVPEGYRTGGPDAYYTYTPAGKYYLPVSTRQAIVKFREGVTFERQRAILAAFPQLEPLDRTKILAAPVVTLIHFSGTPSAAQVREWLRELSARPEVTYANPFLVAPDGVLMGIQQHFLVGLKKGNLADLNRWARMLNVTIEGSYPYDESIYLLNTGKSGLDALRAANLFYESGRFAFAEPDFLLYGKMQHSNDPLLPLQWALNNTGVVGNGTPGADMKVPAAWNMTTGASSVRVAIIDSGVELNHPDLAGNLLPGYDALNLGTNGGPAYNLHPNNGHGTASAGLVAARGGNNIGITGVAYGAKMIPVRWNYVDASGNSVSSTQVQANALNWSWQVAGADILSNSWGGGTPNNLVDNAIANAVLQGRGGAGAVVLFSAGNENGAVSYPASNPYAVAVGATSMCDERKSPTSCDGVSNWGSNYGTGLDVSAPGTIIMSTDMMGTEGYNSGNSFPDDLAYTGYYGGTSAACPNAAGVVALILSVNPDLTVWEARYFLESTCDQVGGYFYADGVDGQPAGRWSIPLGYGRVNAHAAVLAAQNYNGGGANNGCYDAMTVACGESVSGTTSGGAQSVPSCDTDLNTAPGAWFRFNGTGSLVTFSTCSSNTTFDTQIAVFAGDCANLVCETGNDDADDCPEDDLFSTVTVNTEAGTEYLIYVTGYGSSDFGNFTLSVSCQENEGLEMASSIQVDPNPIVQNEPASAAFNLYNFGTNDFLGELLIALYDENGQNGEFISGYTNISLCSGCSFSSDLVFDFTLANPPGQYIIAAWYRELEGEWIQIADGAYDNAVAVEILSPVTTLTVAPDALDFGATSGTAQVSVSSNCGSWTATSSAGWLSVSPGSGGNNGTLTVNYATNASIQSRTATITVSGCGQSSTVSVTQAGAAVSLAVSPAQLSPGASAGTAQVSVSSNCGSWTATSSAGWLSVSPGSGGNNGTLTVNYTANASTQSRTATISVAGCGQSRTVEVTQAGEDVNYPWTATFTGPNHTVIIPATAALSIDGEPLVPGDLIGFFFERDGELHCSNFVVWAGGNTSLPVYGNDADTGTAKNGFAPDERFKIKVYRTQEQTEYLAQASFAPVGTQGVVSHTDRYANDGISMLLDLTATASQTLDISLNAGWNTISSYIAPSEAELLTLLAPIAGEVILLKDQAGQSVIPVLELNNIGNWEVTEGYQVKVHDATTLSITGTRIDPAQTSIPIQAGWQIISYLHGQPGPVATQLAGIADRIEIVKNNAGQAYIPALGIDNIGTLLPTQGYKLKASAPGTLVYPANVTSPPVAAAKSGGDTTPRHFVLDSTLNTGNNSLLVFPAESIAHLLVPGDETGVFTPAGILCGAAVYDGENFAVTAWGDDPTTTAVTEGMQAGETYTIMAWTAADDREAELVPTFSAGDAVYAADDVEFIDFVDIVNATGEPTPAATELRIYPNPAGPFFTVELPTDAVQLELYDLNGRLLRRVSINGGPRQEVVTAGLPRGLLLLSVTDMEGRRYPGRVVLR